MNLVQNLFSNRDKNVGIKLVMIFVLGIAILIFSKPMKKEEKVVQNIEHTNNYERDLELRLENLLSKVYGVGDVKVMITLASSKEIILAEDINTNETVSKEIDKSGNTKESSEKKKESKKIILEGKNPLALKEIEPKVEGIIIIAQGGDNVFIRSELIKSAQTILNVEAHKIQVMKMK